MAGIILGIAVFILFAAGLIGTVIPMMPGIQLILGGVLLYSFVTDFALISGTTVGVISVLAVIGWLSDYYAGAAGAKAAGGGKKAALGAAVGGIVGAIVVLGPIGLLIGTFVGALVGAMLEGTNLTRAHKVAALSVIGAIGAAVVQLIIGIVIIAAFLVALVV